MTDLNLPSQILDNYRIVVPLPWKKTKDKKTY